MRATAQWATAVVALCVGGCSGESATAVSGGDDAASPLAVGADAHPGVASGTTSSGTTPSGTTHTDSSVESVPVGLQVDISAQAHDAGTGAERCLLLTAVVSGGNPPYQYAWTDASWEGPGPHLICESEATSIDLTVTDTAIRGEFGRAALNGEAHFAFEGAAGAHAPDSSVAGGPDAAERADAGGSSSVSDASASHDGPPGGASDAELPRDGESSRDAESLQDAESPQDGDSPQRICACSNDPPGEDEIHVQNPSFDGTPGLGVTPTGWFSCGGFTDVQPAPGDPSAAQRPAAATRGATYVGIALQSGLGQQLRTPLRAGQHYWMSWDSAETGSFVTTGIGIPWGLFEMWLGNSPCQPGQRIASYTWSANMEANFYHACSQFVPDRDYEYITITAANAQSWGPGYVSLDNLRLASYDFATKHDFGIRCAHLPLDTPFP